jgi:hypothetical protein
MEGGFTSNHWNDADGNPAGGTTYGRGFTIAWQNGPLGRGAERKEPNGAFVEDVIAACADRLRHYLTGKFPSPQTDRALRHLEDALFQLRQRTADREARGVEGVHEA